MRFLRPALVATFFLSSRVLVAQNLVPDPSFVSGVSAWSTAAPGTVQFDSRSRHLGTGSALFSVSSGGTAALRTCLPATAGTNYAWGQSLNFPSGPSTASIFWGVTFFDGSGCTGSSLGGSLQPPIVGSTRDVWIDLPSGTVVAPPTAVSVSFSFNYLNAGSDQVTLIDDVFFGPVGTIPPFRDAVDIEGVPSLTSLGLIALSLALVAVGVKGIRGR